MPIMSSSSARAASETRPSTTSSYAASERAIEMETRRIGPRHVDTLVRAVPCRILLRRAGRVFASNEGSAADYALSVDTHTIGYFISHSWRASRVAKFSTLWIFFRLPAALLGGSCSAALAFALKLTHVLPAMANPIGLYVDLPSDVQTSFSMWSSLFSLSGALAAVLAQEPSPQNGFYKIVSFGV